MNTLPHTDVLISFQPLTDEVDPAPLVESTSPKIVEIIPPNKLQDPQSLAEALSSKFNKKSVIIFLPGTAFDKTGTRHGRGGGWYDRFLSAVPNDWIRVGVTERKNIAEKLTRQSWDEPVDFLAIYDSSWEIYETGARSPKNN